MAMNFSSIDRAIEAIAIGKVIIVVDSEDRENEGDFLAAAQTVTPEVVHFMITHARGQLCTPVSEEIAERLGLAPMVPETDDDSLPRFTVPIDHCRCKTGISPLERSLTIQTMVDPYSAPEDYVRPGHIFPLVARRGGVLRRTGHTEAAVDLAQLADLAPAGILCEICSRDGVNMATRDELFQLARQFDLPIITIDALIDYRRGSIGRADGLPLNVTVCAEV